MKNLQQFLDSMVKVEFIEQSKCFGHYPFQMFSEWIDGKTSISSICLGGDVSACYNIFKTQLKANSKRIYMSLDFPSYGDIANDFIAIFSFENEKLDMIAIPYDSNGQVLGWVVESEVLSIIRNQFINAVSSSY